MELLKIERLDHLGVVAGVIKDLGFIEKIDARIEPDEQEEITTGEAIAGMILNGLGFSNRPMSLTPQFFENKPMEVLFREGVKAQYFNRFKLGRSLDKVYSYGCDLLFSELAREVCEQEGIDLRFNDLDTTSFSVSGEYIPDSDEHAIVLMHGYSKDHRPDLKQAVLELMVTQDGGVPFISKSWDGNASDNEVFKERSAVLIEQFKASETPRYLIADSKLYTEGNAKNLARIRFVTRIPSTLKVENYLIEQAWRFGEWEKLEEGYQYQRVLLGHYGIAQRWLVISSEDARQRGEQTVRKAQDKEKNQVTKQLFHLQAQRFESKETAEQALEKIRRKLRYHKIENPELSQHIQYGQKGRPRASSNIQAIRWQIQAKVRPDEEKIHHEQNQKGCFVLGTPLEDNDLTDLEVFRAYKGQSFVERGFRFLKEPVFFVSSLFMSKPGRIQGLLMVMTLALLVYSVAQRRLRKQLQAQGETLPNQIRQPTATPTLRWVFQLLEGISRVVFSVQGHVQVIIDGLSDVRKKIVQLFGQRVCQIYQISSA
jgi:transposase